MRLPESLAGLVSLYLSYAHRELAPSTYEGRVSYLKRFSERYPDLLLCDCKPIHFAQWVHEHPQWGEWAIFSATTSVGACMSWAVRQGVIPVSPFGRLRPRPGKPRRPATEEEFRLLLRMTTKIQRQGSGACFRRVLFGLRWTGMRPKELSDLEWPHVDWRGESLVLWKHKAVRTARSPRPRVIPLVGPALGLLRWMHGRRSEDTPFVFLNSHGRPWNRNSLRLRLERLRRRAGLPEDLKLYGIRHHFGTNAIVQGVDVRTLAELMGHSTTRTTETYLHLAGEARHLKSAMRKAQRRA